MHWLAPTAFALVILAAATWLVNYIVNLIDPRASRPINAVISLLFATLILIIALIGEHA